MKQLISLNGDGNTASFVRGNDGDIVISFDIPNKKVLWECVRVGVGNSGGQQVPGYVKDALINVCEAMERWESEEKAFNKVEKTDLPKGTPVMVNDLCDDTNFYFRYYAGNKKCYPDGKKQGHPTDWDIIIPFDKFNPNDIEESLKYKL